MDTASSSATYENCSFIKQIAKTCWDFFSDAFKLFAGYSAQKFLKIL